MKLSISLFILGSLGNLTTTKIILKTLLNQIKHIKTWLKRLKTIQNNSKHMRNQSHTQHHKPVAVTEPSFCNIARNLQRRWSSLSSCRRCWQSPLCILNTERWQPSTILNPSNCCRIPRQKRIEEATSQDSSGSFKFLTVHYDPIMIDYVLIRSITNSI